MNQDQFRAEMIAALREVQDDVIENTAVFVANLGHPAIAAAIRATKSTHDQKRKDVGDPKRPG